MEKSKRSCVVHPRRLPGRHETFAMYLKKDFRRNKIKYMLVIPVIIYLLLFHYKPMYGIVIAFQRYRPSAGISGSEWIGFDNFIRFLKDPNFWRVVRNTIRISVYSLAFSFPAPIILALMLNEVKYSWFKRTVQTFSYIPHFISLVVVCSMFTTFCQTRGIFNDIIEFFGGQRQALLLNKSMFIPIYILSGIWQNVGWDSIIYLAALAGIDQEQYEAAKIDGAGRLAQIWYITLPGIIPTVSMLLILKIGGILSVGYEKILLLYQPVTAEVAEVISTYVYSKGLIEGNFGYSTAIGLFNSIINIVFLLMANRISKRLGQSGIF